MGAIGWLVDGAAIVNQVSLQGTSYVLMLEPWLKYVWKKVFIKDKALKLWFN